MVSAGAERQAYERQTNRNVFRDSTQPMSFDFVLRFMLTFFRRKEREKTF